MIFIGLRAGSFEFIAKQARVVDRVSEMLKIACGQKLTHFFSLFFSYNVMSSTDDTGSFSMLLTVRFRIAFEKYHY